MKYDKEEKTIFDAYRKGKMTLSSPSLVRFTVILKEN
jgi:hypothetical protein